jgi:hypothetical protein
MRRSPTLCSLKEALTIALVALTVFLASLLTAQAATRRDARGNLNAVKTLTPDESDSFLSSFRNQRMSGEYCLKFELLDLPRNGDPIPYHGVLWGTWNNLGPLTRISLWAKDAQSEEDRIHLLIQGGLEPRVWVKVRGVDEVERLKMEDLMAPLVGSLIYTAFDIQMPFIHWDATYSTSKRVKGRPAHIYRMTPPATFQRAYPGISNVTMTVDGGFQALLNANVMGPEGKFLKTMSVLSFKKIKDDWIVKSIELKDQTTGDKSRFTVLAAALNVDLPDEIFYPESVKSPAALPPAEAFISLR